MGADIIVEDTVLLELKAVEHTLPEHRAQTLTHLRVSGCAIDVLMNFNVALLKDGLHRFIPRRDDLLYQAPLIPTL